MFLSTHHFPHSQILQFHVLCSHQIWFPAKIPFSIWTLPTVYYRPSPKHPLLLQNPLHEHRSGPSSALISGMHVPSHVLSFHVTSIVTWFWTVSRLTSYPAPKTLSSLQQELTSSPTTSHLASSHRQGFVEMAAMASLVKPLAGAAVPVASGGALPGRRLQAGKSAQVWMRGQGRSRARLVVRAAESEGLGGAADAGGNSVVLEVESLPEEPETEGIGNAVKKPKKLSPLERGGSLTGAAAAGKAPAAATLGKNSLTLGAFEDPRWKNGTWDISQFTLDGKVDWDAVIDAEVVRRKLLEANPVSSNNEEPVVFDTSIVPWWAWVKRFHLPEAELLNGRAAMIGYAAGWLVDAATGVGLVDQQNSFLGKLLLFISVVGVLTIRKTGDVETIRNLAEESTFYDKQWQATWKDAKDPEKPEGL